MKTSTARRYPEDFAFKSIKTVAPAPQPIDACLPKTEAMTVITPYALMDVKQIKLNPTYQRLIGATRVKRLKKSMEKYGYFEHKTIILNEINEVIDGQHTYTAAVELGVKMIPVSVVTFPSKEEEAAYFSYINNYSNRLDTASQWNAKLVAGDPLAKALFRMDEDPMSRLFGRVYRKGASDLRERFPVQTIVSIIGASFGRGSSSGQDSLQVESLSKFIGTVPYEELLKAVNRVVDFCFDCFGDRYALNPAFTIASVRAICRLYLELDKAGRLELREYERTVVKMRKFYFGIEYTGSNYQGKLFQLMAHYNSGKGTRKVSMEGLYSE